MVALSRRCCVGGLRRGLLGARSLVVAVTFLLLAAVLESEGVDNPCTNFVNQTAATFSFPNGNSSYSPVDCVLMLNGTVNTYLTFSFVSLSGGDYVAVIDKQNSTVFNSSSALGDVVVAAGAAASLRLVANQNYSGSSSAVRASYSGDCSIQFSDVASVPLHGYVDPSKPIDCSYHHAANPIFAPLSLTFAYFNITSGYLTITNPIETIGNYSGVGLKPDIVQPSSASVTLRLVATARGQSFTGVAASTSAGCTDIIHVTGTYSMSYPASGNVNYDNNLNCRWLIRTADPSHKLMVTVTQLELAADLDRLVVGDGYSSRAIGSPATFQSGSIVGNPILMSGDSAILQFLTDEVGSGKGFSVTFTSLAFGGKYMYNGSISLQFAGKDGCSVNPVTGSCDTYYLLQAEDNKQVVLHLINETLVYAKSMLVYDGSCVHDPLLMRFDTTTPLHPVASSGSQMLIVVQSLNEYPMSLAATFEQQPAGQSKSSWQSADSVALSTLLANSGDMTFWSIQPSASSDANASLTVRLRVDKLVVPYGVKGGVFAGANRALDFELVDPASLPLLLDLPSKQGIWCLFKKNGNTNGTVTSPISFVASYSLVETTVVLAGLTGAVTTPNFPGVYPLGGVYNWTLALPSTKVIHVYFADFALASGHQLVAYSVDSGAVNSSVWSVLASWQGSSLPGDFIYRNNKTSNGSLILGFYLDAMSSGYGVPPAVASGFRILYEVLDCGGNVTNASAVQTPGYPRSVNQSLVCLWIISAPMTGDSPGSVNILNYTLTLVGAVNDTGVQIRDGGSYDSVPVSVPLEDGKPVNVLSSRNQLWIKYNFSAQASGANYSQPGAAFGLSYFAQSCNSSDQCDDGLCIHTSWRCDGIPHCRDGKDEQGCYPGSQPTAPPMQQQGVAYWVLGVSIGGALLLGIVLAVAAPPLYRRCRYRNYSELRDMMAPVPT